MKTSLISQMDLRLNEDSGAIVLPYLPRRSIGAVLMIVSSPGQIKLGGQRNNLHLSEKSISVL